MSPLPTKLRFVEIDLGNLPLDPAQFLGLPQARDQSRFFWSAPGESSVTLAAFGDVHRVATEGPARFERLRARCLQDAAKLDDGPAAQPRRWRR